MKPCLRCHGTKFITHKGFTGVDGQVYPDRTNPCYCCKGTGEFPEVNEPEIRQAISAKQGKNKGKLRASMTSPLRHQGVEACRAYYVWRLARFHGGMDMRQPVMADMLIGGDPFTTELNQLADRVAKENFGTDMAAALRWGKALGVLR